MEAGASTARDRRRRGRRGRRERGRRRRGGGRISRRKAVDPIRNFRRRRG
jgi:hypothetical protein